MTSIKLTVTGAQAWAEVSGPLTSGMVGLPVTMEYDGAWEGLTKNLVCRCSPWGSDGGEHRSVLNVDTSAVVAHEVMQAGMYLYLGVEGFSDDGALVIPSTWACCGEILPGADAGADPSADPELSVWEQLQTEIRAIGDSAVTEDRVEAVVETYLKEQPNQGGGDYSFLHGLKYYAFGDSIVDMQGTLTAPETFGDTGYSKDLQGRDISGVTVEGYVTAVERRYGLVASNFGLGGHTIVGDYAMIASKDFSDVALVTIAYGVNDARTGVPLGTVNSTDVSTFAGAMNVILKKIYTDNPECRVLILSPMQRLRVTNFGIADANANGDYLIDFVNMCRAIAEKRSTAFLDQYRCTGINQTNLYYYTVEGVHPVNQGFARIRNAVIGILDELFALEYEPFGVMTNTGNTEPDEPDTGGDTGDDTPPEEDTTGASIDLTDKFVYDAIIYDCYVAEPNLVGSAGYNASSANVCTGPIAMEAGKVYTMTTYWSTTPAYLGLVNGAESRGSYVDGAWVANRVGATTINKSKCVQITETIDGVDYIKMVYSYTPTEPKWLWIGSERANMGMTTLICV